MKQWAGCLTLMVSAPMFLREDDIQGLAQSFLARPAEDNFGLRIPTDDGTVDVYGDDGIKGSFNN